MAKSILKSEVSAKLAVLYRHMEEAYRLVATALDFSCASCPDNCCDSYFQHHTVIEWAYLWEGLGKLPKQKLAEIRARAAAHQERSCAALLRGERPSEMCPLNEKGLCSVYLFRLMICRMHGVPSCFKKPDGGRMSFPGCGRCQELVSGRRRVPEVDRTELYRELASLEQEVLQDVGFKGPRVKMTIAEMIMKGAPQKDF